MSFLQVCRMTDTPPGVQSSWVDLARYVKILLPCVERDIPRAEVHSPHIPASPVPFHLDQDYIKMLKEAQRESSTRSSARVSPLSSAMMSVSSTSKNTPSSSPKSPPNSPNVELAYFHDLKEQLKAQGVFINREPGPTMDDILKNTEWHSRPNMMPPRTWRPAQVGTSSNNSSGRGSESGKKNWNRDVIFTVISSNALSLVLGIGLGYWLFRKNNL